MITKFKIFESVNIEKYIDNFIIQKSGDTHNIIMCVDIRLNYKDSYFVEFDCFDFDKEFNFEIYGDHENFSQKGFEKFASESLTPVEFYNKYTDICTYFYEKIKDEFHNLEIPKDGGDGGWYPKFIKNFKRVLETIPEFEHFAVADKYNL